MSRRNKPPFSTMDIVLVVLAILCFLVIRALMRGYTFM